VTNKEGARQEKNKKGNQMTKVNETPEKATE
jgi:hypothetical protein